MGQSMRGYLDFAVETAYLAGKMTLGYFQTGIHADIKADGSPVTSADRQAEALIRKRIEATYPGHAIIGEEYGSSGSDGASHRWIIDPIDGTKSFVHGVPLYAVLIGMEVEGNAEVGAVYFPALDEMLSAASGEGCWWNGRRARVSQTALLKDSTVCYTEASVFWREEREPAFQQLLRRTRLFTGWNDAFGYLLVATGRADAMVDPAMNPWDAAPYPAILREAGGVYCDWNGRQTIYGRDGLAANSALLPELLELLQGKAENATPD